MKGFQNSFRKTAIFCIVLSLAAALGLWVYRQWMAWVYPFADMVSSSLYWLFFPLMIAPLIAAAFLAARRGAIGKGPLCLASAVVLLVAAVALVPVFRYRDSGSLEQTIAKKISPQATVERASIFYRTGDYRLEEEQVERLWDFCRSTQVSTQLPADVLRPSPVSSAALPCLTMVMDNPEDRSRTYFVDIVCYSEDLALLQFYQSSGGGRVELLYAVEGDEIYQLVQENLENLQYPEI